MALPLVAASAIGTAVGLGISLPVQAYWSTYVQPSYSPSQYGTQMRAWRTHRIMEPTPQQVLEAWTKNGFTNTGLAVCMRNQGIDLPDNWYNIDVPSNYQYHQNVWTRVCQAAETPLPWQIVYNYNKLGLDIGMSYTRAMNLHGFNTPSKKEVMLDPQAPLTISDAIEARNRGLFSSDDFFTTLSRLGYTGTRERSALNGMRYHIPGPADLISFAVREVFDPAITARFNYDAEFPQSFQVWMDKQGMGWKPSDAGYAVPAEQDITWPRAYWRAHWQMMSPTQASFAVHYLRPAKAGSTESRIPGVSAFTQADFDTILRIADYPPIIRNYLYGLSFSPLTRVDVRRMRRMGIMTDEEVFEAFRDIGYSEENARRLVAFTAEEARRVDSGRDRARMETIIRDTYSNGLITPGEAARWLFMLRKTSPDEQEKFRSLPEAEQETQALARPEIRLLLETITLGKQAKIAKAVLRATRASYLRREISADQARLLMQNVGVEQQDISLNLQLWSVEQTIKGKPATQAQVITWLKRGAINAQEAVQRLVNMGVSSRDINIILGLTSQDISLAAAKEQEKLFKTGREARRAQEQQLKEMAANRRRIMADINKSASRETILRWLKKRLITPLEAYQAIVKRGTFPTDAVIYVAEVAQQLGEEYVKQIAEIQAEAEKASPVATGLEPSSNGVQQQSKEVP